jgi:hypothetical protein
MNPTKILNPLLRISFKPKNRGFKTKIEKRNATLTIAGGEEEMRGRRFRGEEMTI